MGKKSSGKHYVSKGERRSSIKTPNKDKAQRMLNQVNALAKGKRIVMTLENPDKNGPPFIRVMYDARTPKGQVLS